MRRNTSFATTLVAFPIALFATSLLSAQTVVINYTDQGWYNNLGQHEPGLVNYFVGDASRLTETNDMCNFFVFDLSGVTQPILSAKLAVFVPGGSGYNSPDPSENYELHDVVTSIAALMAGTGGVAAHTDLGSGVVYGSRTMTNIDEGVVEIELNSAAVTAMNETHGLFAMGGSLTTLDELSNEEYTFAATGYDRDVTHLRLTLVPEPSTFILLGIGAIGLLGYRRRHR